MGTCLFITLNGLEISNQRMIDLSTNIYKIVFSLSIVMKMIEWVLKKKTRKTAVGEWSAVRNSNRASNVYLWTLT